MQRILLAIVFILTFPVVFSNDMNSVPERIDTKECEELYEALNLNDAFKYEIFKQAYVGYKKIRDKEKEILTIIDFTKPSNVERLFVLDLKSKKVLHSSLVSHGRNSGELYATSFSNKSGSFKSSLGFYLTMNTYIGKNGYSLILDGLEEGINDNAKKRAIVVHGAPYCEPSVVAGGGRLGRSLGCPALPPDVAKIIIDTIKNGSLMFIYADSKDYLANSPVLSTVENET